MIATEVREPNVSEKEIFLEAVAFRNKKRLQQLVCSQWRGVSWAAFALNLPNPEDRTWALCAMDMRH